MAKVHPHSFTSSSSSSSSSSSTPSSSSSSSSSERETFTIWMKSLVLNGNGCTVYDSNGKIVYRVDNYDSRCSSEVYIMDLPGKVLCSILRKKLEIFGRWEGYKCDAHNRMKNEKPWFQVRKNRKLLKGHSSVCEVTVGCNKAESKLYRIEKMASKLAFKIIDSEQRLLAEVQQKQSSSGVVLGNDVLSLVVEPHIDVSLIVALVTVYGLISHKM